HGAHEQQQAQHRQGVPLVAEEFHALASEARCRAEYRVKADTAENGKRAEDAKREAEVAHAVDDEGLDGRSIGLGLQVPEPDQKVGSEPDTFPAEKHL